MIEVIKKIVIENNKILENNKCIFQGKTNDFLSFCKLAYKNLGINYPKFHKMDALSKLAFISAEHLLKGNEEKNTALVLGNTSSSLNTDILYQNSINRETEYHPSPSTFVYTLPNICIGEICIRHRLQTENTFFVLSNYDYHFFHQYASWLLNTQKATQCIYGWVEVLNGEYYSEMTLLSST